MYEGLKIRGAFSIHQGYLYTISDTMKTGKYSVTKFLKDGTQDETEIAGKRDPSGLYVYDVNAMLNGQV